jgi:hypothetical protein
MDNLSCGIVTSWLNVGDSMPHLNKFIQRYFTPVFVRTMLATDSGRPQKVDGMDRIEWSTSTG